jgi:hypothetical protein
MNSGYNLASQLGADYPEVNSLSTWDNVNKMWETSVNYGDGFWWQDAALTPNQPFFVTVTENVDIFIAGSLNEQTSFDLTANANGDFNVITLPVDSSYELASTLNAELTEMSTLSSWNNVDKMWETAVNYGDGFWWPDTTIYPASVYLISVTADVVWPDLGRSNQLTKTKSNKK